MVDWHRQTVPGPTPHGGALARVLYDADEQAVVITEYDGRGLVINSFEWQVDDDRSARDGGSVTLTVTDWDRQVVERRSACGLPPLPVEPDDLRALLRLAA